MADKKQIFKKIIKYALVAGVCYVCIIFIGALIFGTGAFKYLTGSLLNGVNLNTPTASNRYAYGENIGWVDFNPTGGRRRKSVYLRS